MADDGKENKCLSTRKFDIFIAVLLLVGCIFCACSLLLPNWTKYTHPGTSDTYHYGVYMTCVDQRGGRLCISTHLDMVSGSWSVAVKVIGSFWGIAYVLTLGAAFLVIIRVQESKKWFLLATAVMAILTGILSLITIAVYGGIHSNLDLSYDFAFYFAVVSLLLSILTIPLALYRRHTHTWKQASADDSDVISHVSFEMPFFVEREVTINFGPSDTTMRDPRTQRFMKAQHDLSNDRGRWNEGKDVIKEEETDDNPEKKEKRKRPKRKRKSKKIKKAYKNIQEGTKVRKLDEL